MVDASSIKLLKIRSVLAAALCCLLYAAEGSRHLLDSVTLSKQQREANRLACIAEEQAEYRRIIGEHVKGKHAILVDMVDHWNLGDSFIQLGEQLFLEQMGSPIEAVCTWESCDWDRMARSFQEDPRPPVLLIHGGGNFGDIWGHLRNHHLDIIRRYPNIPIVFLPQSVHYSQIEEAVADSAVFAQHPNLQLFARDLNSLSFLRNYFSTEASTLSPDAAFNIGPVDSSDCSPDVDVLILGRTDKEKIASGEDEDQAVQILVNNNRTYVKKEWWWCVDRPEMPPNPLDEARVKFEMGKRCLCRGRVIVTDRLHATILATLMGLPHVFLDNEYGKIHTYRVAHYQPKPFCSDASLRAHRAPNWNTAMKIANEILQDGL